MIDCAVIGGGPVGLVFAILSHSNQSKIQIFEAKKCNALYQDSRALALSNGSQTNFGGNRGMGEIRKKILQR